MNWFAILLCVLWSAIGQAAEPDFIRLHHRELAMEFSQLTFTRDSRTLVVFNSQTIRIINAASGIVEQTLALKFSGGYLSKMLHLNRANTLIAILGPDEPDGLGFVAALFSFPEGRLIRSFPIGLAGRGMFSSDDKLFIAYASKEENIVVVNPLTGLRIKTLEKHEQRVDSVSLSPTGDLLVTADSEQITNLWRTQDWKWLRRLPTQSSVVLFSPDGKYLASDYGSVPQLGLNLWDMAKNAWKFRKPIHEFPDPNDALAFSPDSKLIISSGEKTTYVSSVETGKLMHQFPYSASSIAFSPDGKYLAFAASEGRGKDRKYFIHIYSAPDGSAVFNTN